MTRLFPYNFLNFRGAFQWRKRKLLIKLKILNIFQLRHSAISSFLFSESYSTKPLCYSSIAMGSARSLLLPNGTINPSAGRSACTPGWDVTHHTYLERVNFPFNKEAESNFIAHVRTGGWWPNNSQFLACYVFSQWSLHWKWPIPGGPVTGLGHLTWAGPMALPSCLSAHWVWLLLTRLLGINCALLHAVHRLCMLCSPPHQFH